MIQIKERKQKSNNNRNVNRKLNYLNKLKEKYKEEFTSQLKTIFLDLELLDIPCVTTISVHRQFFVGFFHKLSKKECESRR